MSPPPVGWRACIAWRKCSIKTIWSKIDLLRLPTQLSVVLRSSAVVFRLQTARGVSGPKSRARDVPSAVAFLLSEDGFQPETVSGSSQAYRHGVGIERS